MDMVVVNHAGNVPFPSERNHASCFELRRQKVLPVVTPEWSALVAEATEDLCGDAYVALK